MRRTFPPPLALILLLGACADMSGYPSLAPRPIERADAQNALPAPETPVQGDAARDTRAAALAGQAATADRDFAATAERTCRIIAAGRAAAQGSEAWVAAQQALSALDAGRGAVRGAAAELDQLLIDSNAAAGGPIDTSRLAAAAAQVGALEATEQSRMDAIAAGGGCG